MYLNIVRVTALVFSLLHGPPVNLSVQTLIKSSGAQPAQAAQVRQLALINQRLSIFHQLRDYAPSF